MKYQIEYCPHCGQRMPIEYKHGLTKILVKGLFNLYNAPRHRANLNKIIEQKSEYTNFQKLRYFGLAIPTHDDTGEWFITKKGIDFIFGKIKVSQYVWTRQAQVTRFSSEVVGISDIKDCIQYKQEWQEQAAATNLLDLIAENSKDLS